MKLIPYTNLRAAIPAMTLVAANATVMLGPAVQLASVLVVLLLVSRELEADLRTSWVLLGYVSLCVGIGLLTYGSQPAVIKAGKLAMFCLASVLAVRGADGDKSFPALVALRAFLGLCALNFLYAATTGNKVFRSNFLIEFSIYSAYTIALLVYLARLRLTVFDRGAAWLFSLLCGSTMGILVLILAEVVGRRPRPRTLLGVLALTPIGFLALNFLMKARGKEFTWDYLANSDRALLLTTFYEMLVPIFSVPNWFFGLGVGRPLPEFVVRDDGFSSYLLGLGEGHVYSFCLHNEPLRILCDFGLVGLVLVGLRLWSNCSKPVLVLLGVCLLTNSYLYSFSGALVASSLFNTRRVRGPSPSTESEPSPRAPAPSPV